MKETLRMRLEYSLKRMSNRLEQLQNNIEYYKETGDYENAMKSDIKYRQLSLVLKELAKVLNG